MDEDIDIEEHDVLDNPLIKNMFLEISNIKTEVEDYEEKDTSIDIEEDYHNNFTTVSTDYEQDNNLTRFNNKIIIGSKPSTSTQIQDVDHSSTNDQVDTDGVDLDPSADPNDPEVSYQEPAGTDVLPLLEESFSNKIILGTKTLSSDESDSDEYNLPEVSVLLEDCGSFLEDNPCFCKECEILFPTENDLHSHKMMAHSFLVAVTKNKAVKSTSKHTDYNKLLCTHCNVVFPSTIDLLKHTYELLPNKTFNDTKPTNISPKATTSLANIFYMCPICTCHFKLPTKLQTHTMMLHNMNDISDVKPELSNFRCRICDSKLGQSKSYNIHITLQHSDLYRRKFNDESSRFKCPLCGTSFSSDYSLRIHLAAKHGIYNKAPAKKITKACNNFALIAKSTVFKCNKCHMHFLSCAAGVAHIKSCVLEVNGYRCNKCRRYFRSSDKLNHIYQHSLTDRFKVVDITKNILNRILCKCDKCNTCFDEVSLKSHTAGACSAETPAIYCAPCNHWINAKAMPLHKKIHASGVTANDFIHTEYVQTNTISNTNEGLDVNNDEFNEVKEFKETKRPVTPPTKLVKSKGLVKKFRRSDDMAYLYCPTCKCFMKANKIKDKHNIGKCNIHMPTVTCKCCGLRFTHKGYTNHCKVHKKYPKLQLKDLKFINTQNYKRINPPYPKFEQCKVCKVTFFSQVALNSHVCNAETPQLCGYCNQKFSDLAYNLHVKFHEYANQFKMNAVAQTSDKMSKGNENIPELMKKYKSLKQIWNILFLCQTCDIIIDSYDRVVEHCQDHFCNMESYNVTIEHCDICNLKFVDESYQKHKELHLRDDFNKDSFKIIEYSYDNLLSNDWLRIFKSLTEEQTNLILSKSMYKYSRCVRMKVIRNGSPSMALYQCGKCNLIVAPSRVTEHSQNINKQCEIRRRFNCTKCTLKFVYKSQKIAHEKLHEVRKITAASFKIIEFHAEKQFSVTEVVQPDELSLGTEEAKDSAGLKFIRCQHCGKLIQKHKYKMHSMYHIYYDRAKIKEANKLKGVTKFIIPKTVHTFHKCIHCGICVSKNNAIVHNCNKGRRQKCSKCSLWFRAKNIQRHYKLHEMYKFNRSNVNVVCFNKKSNASHSNDGHEVNSKELIIYQCAKCAICLWNKVNIQRHSCTVDGLKESCDVCGITYIRSHRHFHLKMHEIKDFDRSNVTLIQFNETSSHRTNKRKAIACEEAVAKKSRVDTPLHEDDESEEELNVDDVSEEKLNVDDTSTITSETFTDIDVDSDRSIEKAIKTSRCPGHEKLFKCKTCKLLFMSIIGLIDHENQCDNAKEASECSDCGLVFHASQIDAHKKLQKCEVTAKLTNLFIYIIKKLGKSYKLADNWLFLCSQCQICNISIAGMHYHLESGHRIKKSIKTCSTCDIQFTSRSYIQHLRTQHNSRLLSKSDLSIAEVVTVTLKDLLEDFETTASGKNLRGSETKAGLRETKTNSISNESGIYTCDICNLNFLHPRSLYRHKEHNKHNEARFNCPKCDLVFTRISLKRHLLHHTKTKNIKNIADVNDSIVESIPKIFDDNLSMHSKTDSVDYDNIPDTYNSNQPSTSNQNRVDNKSEPTVNAELGNSGTSKNKIFKCSVCDVYFLTADDCYEHTFAHTELDATEYIACKVCELQFCCEFLGRHMKMHREKTFTMDGLTVVEYRPSSSGLAIDTYLAVDRLLSSTTHFDTEDDKNCVDSTTNETVT